MEQTFRGLAVEEMKTVWATRATDARPRISSGWPMLDEMLNRGGFAPGEVVVLGGRTHTRKTTVMLNWCAALLRGGVTCGIVGLDEPTPSYIAKLASIFTGVPHAQLEDNWDDMQDRLGDEFWPAMQNLWMSQGYRPDMDQLTDWRKMALTHERPRVIFIDYAGLLARDKYHGGDATRIPRVFEDLQVWTSDNEVVTIVVHQVSRGDHGREYVPMQLDHLKYGGEEFADVVLATYRPALDPLGQCNEEQAQMMMGDSWDDVKWQAAVQKCRRYEHSTMLQLLKNRPGVHLSHEGIELRSPSESMAMRPADNDDIDTGKVVKLHG